MDIKYNITKLKGSIKEEVQDHISVEEPLEMSLKFKRGDKWNVENISRKECLLLPFKALAKALNS